MPYPTIPDILDLDRWAASQPPSVQAAYAQTRAAYRRALLEEAGLVELGPVAWAVTCGKVSAE